MTTTPTLWGQDVTVSNDIFAFGVRVAALNDGTFVMSWEDGSEIFARQLSELGSFTGGNFLQTVSGNVVRPLATPIVFQQTDDRVVVNYDLDDGDSPIDHDVFWVSPNSDFSVTGSPFGTESSPNSEVLRDAVARPPTSTGPGGGAIVYDYTTGGSSFVVLRFTSSIGEQASNQIFIDSSATRTELNPALASLHTGFVAIAYESFGPSDSSRDIRMKVYTPDGTNVSGDLIVSGNTNAAFPDVTELQGGSFVVAWQQSNGIAFRRYIGNGIADGGPVVIPNTGGGFVPKITALNDGGFIVAWSDIDGTESDASPELDIFLQRFDAGGVAVGDIVHLDKAGDQGLFDMNISTLSDGRVVLVYSSETGDATNLTELKYQIFDPREQLIDGTNDDDNFVSREDGATIKGYLGNDKLTGRLANDTLIGNQDDDTLFGSGGDDRLRGGEGDDIIKGGAGKDQLLGSTGADQMTGGSKADTFLFQSIADSTVLALGQDTIVDFNRSHNDKIDLSGIDAKANVGGNQAFTFIGSNGFHDVAGELRAVKQNGDTFIRGDVDGNGVADFVIRVEGKLDFQASDFDL
jgi:Ca2+-binding RTX toxin-like protein